ncbi:UNVERIFIED_CONTAM: hypothetical protein Sindi_1004200 [Sesamum indicum]
MGYPLAESLPGGVGGDLAPLKGSLAFGLRGLHSQRPSRLPQRSLAIRMLPPSIALELLIQSSVVWPSIHPRDNIPKEALTKCFSVGDPLRVQRAWRILQRLVLKQGLRRCLPLLEELEYPSDLNSLLVEIVVWSFH